MNDAIVTNNQVIEEFRANGGRVGGMFEGAPLLLLTTLGAKSGLPRVTPLLYLADGDRYLVFASNGGGRSPAWFANLRANPSATVEVGNDKFDATATVLTGRERDEWYARVSEAFPQFAEYQERASRVIPVVALQR
ncbi:MAG TPA: nitroreductase family deazaflavin-dependent oxidoreductase [Actinopolymorphaceae bacterium]